MRKFGIFFVLVMQFIFASEGECFQRMINLTDNNNTTIERNPEGQIISVTKKNQKSASYTLRTEFVTVLNIIEGNDSNLDKINQIYNTLEHAGYYQIGPIPAKVSNPQGHALNILKFLGKTWQPWVDSNIKTHRDYSSFLQKSFERLAMFIISDESIALEKSSLFLQQEKLWLSLKEQIAIDPDFDTWTKNYDW